MRSILLAGLSISTLVAFGPCDKPSSGSTPATGASGTPATTAASTPASGAAGTPATTAASTPASGAAATPTSAGAPSQCSVVGSFKGRPNTARGPATSEVKAGADGSFSLAVTLDANHATTTLAGTYTMSGNQITVVNTSGTASNGAHINACPGVKGVYSLAWSADCKQMTWTKVSDSCPPREQEASGVTLTRE